MISNVANGRQLAGVYKWTVYTTRLDVDRSVGVVRNLVQSDNRTLITYLFASNCKDHLPKSLHHTPLTQTMHTE